MAKGTAYYGLDIASDKIVALKAVVNSRGQIVDITSEIGQAAGIKNGSITELGVFSNSISQTIKRLSVSSGDKIKSLYVCLQGPFIKTSHSLCALALSERSNKIITSSDVLKVNQHAYSLGLSIEEQVLHQIPQEYTIDGQNKVLNPAGLYGHKLQADLFLVSAQARDVQNLISAIDQAGYKARAVVLSALATGLAVVSEENKKKGCCLLDVGFDSSAMLIFKDGIPRGYEYFNFGSHHLSEALSRELKLPYALAEDLKISYGSVFAHTAASEQEVLVKKDQVYRAIKRKQICLIIEKELQVFFQAFKERLEAYQKTFTLAQGVLVSGKAALLEGFIESLEQKIGVPVHLAKVENALSSDTTYATAIGLVYYALSQHSQINFFKFSSYGNIFQKISRKSKEIYHEYF